MSLNWNNLRPWNGSRRKAFEELCCQLASCERVPEGSKFTRKGDPDAGVECFWKLPNGDEWGWQAKFFLSPPSRGQWRQLDDSIRRALKKHDRLIKYTICLPIDLPDPRVEGQDWSMDTWNERVERWKRWAQEKGMSVEFEYWGEHQIFERLSREEHRGRHFFWFNRELFSKQWFERRVEEAIANVGPRYTPELNIELPISRLFDALGRTSEYYNRLAVLFGEIKRAYFKFETKKIEDVGKHQFDSLKYSVNALLSILERIEKSETDPINFDDIEKLTDKSLELAWECDQALRDVEVEEKKKASPLTEKYGQAQRPYKESEDFRYERHLIYRLTRHLDALQDFVKSNEARLYNLTALLLLGDAGTGKTHLFCDLAKQMVQADLPTVLLLGGHFINEEPWSQVLKLLGLSCSKEDFLGALEAAAQARGSKALILIDALNEGEGKRLWDNHLAGMLTTISWYKRLGVAVSARTSYESTVIPKGVVPNRLIKHIHFGFADHEYQATRRFFEHFGIELPSVPLLHPEFQNPLFLKLFCQGLHNRGLTRVPPGLQGMTKVFDFFIDSVNDRLSRPEFLNYDPNSKIVQRTVDELAEIMAERGTRWLPREEARVAVDTFLPREGFEHSLFRHIISEGLLSEGMFRAEESEELSEGIYFSYERFTDQLVAKRLLDKHLDPDNPSTSFLPDQPLGSLLRDESACWWNRGLIEAFSIQLPEHIEKELVEVVPRCADFWPVREAFVESVVWRNSNAFTDATFKYINEHVIKYRGTHDQFLNTLLNVAPNPDHPLNSDLLHSHLMKFQLAERDAWWSIFLHNNYYPEENGPIARLIEWAWSADDKGHISDESIRLFGIALAWLLTTSNRFLRDRATKALVSLLTNRISVLRQVLHRFIGVNDPYVLERLFAVAYGCAMRSKDSKELGELAQNVYDWIFKDDSPPPHILLRDYARGVIEAALHRGLELNVDMQKVRPPYKSEWPSEIPSEEELENIGQWREGMPDEERALLNIRRSVMGGGDFDTYVVGSLTEWSSWRLGEPRPLSREEIHEDFVQRLTERQRKAWERYITSQSNLRIHHFESIIRKQGSATDESTEENLISSLESSERVFRGTLRQKKRKIFDEYIIDYLNHPTKYRQEDNFDSILAKRLIFQRVLDLGWAADKFGRFDKDVISFAYSGRESNKPERIGKKYQWIAYHEVLARISDNFVLKDDEMSGLYGKYEGPWQLTSVRDIDPSCLLKKTEREGWEPRTNTWWFPYPYEDWESEHDDVRWLENINDLPDVEPLIEVTNLENNSNWLVMETHHRWEQPTPPGEERYDIPKRTIWYTLRSYITKKKNMKKLFAWAKKQDFWQDWMPRSHELYRVFIGEFFWSPAFQYHNIPYYHNDGWTRGREDKIPVEVLVSTDGYLQEYSGYDCSIDDSINIFMPCKWLADHMGLEWNGAEGQFFDHDNNLIAYDPSARTPGPGALLVNRNVLRKFLDENGYDILWILIGGKDIIGGPTVSREEWKGRLKINGAFRISENRVAGERHTEFMGN